MAIDPRNMETIDEREAAFFRSLTPGQRLRALGELVESSRVFMRAGVRMQHPSWTEEQVRAEVLRRVRDDAA